jgi:hypothetical protein
VRIVHTPRASKEKIVERTPRKAAASGWIGSALEYVLAAWSARETFRIHLDDLGSAYATPVPADDYARLRATAL